jgi:Cu-processing system permease protein
VSVMSAVLLITMLTYRVPVHAALFQAIELIFIELLLVTAMALCFSTFSSSTLSAIMTIGLYVIGHLTTDMKGIAEKSHNDAIKFVMTALYYICPNLEVLNIKGQAATGISVTATYQALATGYGVLYATLLVLSACAVFQRRDF